MMKKYIIFLSILLITNNLVSQSFDCNQKNIEIGIGPMWMILGESLMDGSVYPSFSLSYEMGIPENIVWEIDKFSAGITISYIKPVFDDGQLYLSIDANYHFINKDKFEMYAGLNVTKIFGGAIRPFPLLGARYYWNESFGMYYELSIPSILGIGFTYRFE